MDPTVNNYVTVPSAVNLFVAAVCWLVCLFFLLFGRTALIGGVKERECEVQVSDMLLLPSIRIDFHCPLVAALTGSTVVSFAIVVVVFFCHRATLLLEG